MQKPDVFTRMVSPELGVLSAAGRRFLAEGDSWFTLGTLNLTQGTNLLMELQFKQKNAVMSWAPFTGSSFITAASPSRRP